MSEDTPRDETHDSIDAESGTLTPEAVASRAELAAAANPPSDAPGPVDQSVPLATQPTDFVPEPTQEELDAKLVAADEAKLQEDEATQFKDFS